MTKQVKKSKKFSTAEEYFDSKSGIVKELLLDLRKHILSCAPHAEETLFYNVPAYRIQKGKKRDELILIAGFKNHVGFYPHTDVISNFSNELKSYKTSSGTVQFPLTEELPKGLIINMVKAHIERIEKSQQ